MAYAPSKDLRFVHCIDEEDRIVHLNGDWLDFGRENGARWGSLRDVLDTSIWSWISDGETRQLYQAVVERVREGSPPVRLPFRCDAPHLKRFMEMEIADLGGGIVRFESRILSEERRRPVPVLDPWTDRSDELLRMCSWCKRVWLEEGRWVEVEEAVAALELFAAVPPPFLTHGMCTPCYEIVREEIAASAGLATTPLAS